MGKAVSRGQALQVSARVATQVNWDKLDGDSLQRDVISLSPEEFGRRFTEYLRNGARIIRESNLLRIDRSVPFNPTKFLGEGWSIWRGPADGDGLSGDEDQDQRSLGLTELDLSKIQFVTCLRGKETHIGGEEKLRRLKASSRIRLDAKIFQTLWENKDRIPEILKEKTNGYTTYVFFDGTILRCPDGNRCVLCFCWFGGGWDWSYGWLDYDWYSLDPSAVLAS
jgi:hypothetical protein